ncbi:MAG: MATE family efflux transporter [Bacteroidota bacterium]
MDKRDLTTGSVSQKLIQLTLPMMLGIVSMVAFNLIDTYFVGKLGKNELAALSFTFPVIMIIFSIIQGLGIGATALISKSIGRNDRAKAARETTDSVILTLIITGIFVLIGLSTIQPTFEILGADGVTSSMAQEYMTIWYFALFFVSVPFVGNSAIRSTGDAKTPTYIMLFAVLVNAILDPILIFGYLGFPALGLRGAAIATAISRAMTMILSFYILIKREHLITFTIPSRQVIIGCWGSLLSIALPSSLAKLIVPLAIAVITSMLSVYGEHAVAAFGVGSRIEFLATSILFALGASIGPFVGQNIGKNRLDRVNKSVTISNKFSILWGLFVWIILIILARPIGSIFTQNEEVIDVVALFLWIVPVGFGLQGILGIVNSYLNTINKPMLALRIIFLQMLIVGLPLMYLGRYVADVKGIFIGLAATYIFGGLLSLFILMRNRV